MFALFIHDDASDDLRALRPEAPRACARIVAFLQQIKADQGLLDRLTQHGYTEEFDVSKWLRQWNRGRDLWRLKLWDLEKQGLQYRIVYAYIPGKQHYHVLGVAPRHEFNYDDDDPFTRRVLEAYEDLCG